MSEKESEVKVGLAAASCPFPSLRGGASINDNFPTFSQHDGGQPWEHGSTLTYIVELDEFKRLGSSRL